MKYSPQVAYLSLHPNPSSSTVHVDIYLVHNV
jgi:hypothetical protein